MKNVGGTMLIVLAALAMAACEPEAVQRTVSGAGPLRLEVWVDGIRAPLYTHEGKSYVEALKGREYSIRLVNTSARRIAVALSVDGLNTVDAKRTSAREATKWVIDPHDEVTVSGWQVSSGAARKFFFTSEEDSYGAALGKTENLGIISAAVFYEKEVRVTRDRADETAAGNAPAPEAAPAAPAPESKRVDKSSAAPGSAPAGQARVEKEEYAATGMGDEVDNRVERVALDLEPEPCQAIDVRYEFRAQLVRLGVIPEGPERLDGRERASGFTDEYCPEK
ncbi:MAG: hypothetical protein KA419_15625 [Acidobacteria bacterium]|nr:hypothetical protein [Acidobacteriota bacterium]